MNTLNGIATMTMSRTLMLGLLLVAVAYISKQKSAIKVFITDLQISNLSRMDSLAVVSV